MKTLTFKRNILIHMEWLAAVAAVDLFSIWLSKVNSLILLPLNDQQEVATTPLSGEGLSWQIFSPQIFSQPHIRGESRGCRWPTCRLLVHRLQDQNANIICRKNELCSRHIVFLIARLHHVQSQPKLNNCQRLPHLCDASAWRGGRDSPADGGWTPNAF